MVVKRVFNYMQCGVKGSQIKLTWNPVIVSDVVADEESV